MLWIYCQDMYMALPLSVLRPRYSQLLVGGEAILYTLWWSLVERPPMYLANSFDTSSIDTVDIARIQTRNTPLAWSTISSATSSTSDMRSVS